MSCHTHPISSPFNFELLGSEFFVPFDIHKRPLNQLKIDSKTDAPFPSGLPPAISLCNQIRQPLSLSLSLSLSLVRYIKHLASLSVSCAMCEFEVKTC